MKPRTQTQYFLDIELIALEEHLSNALDRTTQLRAATTDENDVKRLNSIRQLIRFTRMHLESLRRGDPKQASHSAELQELWDIESPS